MSDVVSKRHRISFVGTFDRQGYFRIEPRVADGQLRQFHPDLVRHHVGVEELPDPLPTTPGSVVMVTRDHTVNRGERVRIVLQLDPDDAWHGTSGQRWITGQVQDEAGGHLHGEITVLFDAGADQ